MRLLTSTTRTFTCQRCIQNLDRTSDNFPTPGADAFALAASSDFVIVCHIYIKDEFALYGLECLFELQTLVLWSRIVYRSYFETRWI